MGTLSLLDLSYSLEMSFQWTLVLYEGSPTVAAAATGFEFRGSAPA